MANALSSIRDRAIQLLGQGVPNEQVSSALGVTPSAISQLVADPEVQKEIAELRFKNLSKHNERDNALDDLEDTLIGKVKDGLMFLGTDPMKAARLLAIVNSAKRRGQSAPDHIIAQQTVINLTLPVQVLNQFTKNVNNQVVKAGAQELVTVQSGQMTKLLEAQNVKHLPAPTAGTGESCQAS